MPDAFFSSKSRKRKRPHAPIRQNHKPDQLSSDEDEWGGIDDLDLRPQDPDPGASGDEDPDETPAQKRLRLAHLYLDSLKESLADGEYDAAEIDKQLISSRLQQDVLSHSGKIHLFIADSFSNSLLQHNTIPLPTLRTRGHRFSITSAVTSDSCKYLYTAGKEGSIIKWDLRTGKKLALIHKTRPAPRDFKGKSKAEPQPQGHTDQILALALSSDGKYLASGGKDRRLLIWDTETLTLLKSFHGPLNHKDTISALSFRSQTHQLYTTSFDRTLKLYDLTPNIMGYVETLFGHQHPILSLDSLKGEYCVSAGGRDKTARYWKILDETQLVFRGGGSSGKRNKLRQVLEGGIEGEEEEQSEDKEMNYVEGSLECVAMIDETTFITGGDSGTISLWVTSKKKPVFNHPLAHGLTTTSSTPDIPPIHKPRWITSLASLPYSDLFVSGSYDGYIRFWKLDSKLKSFSPLSNGKNNHGLPIPGIINSLQLIQPPKSFFSTPSGTDTTNKEWPPALTTTSTTTPEPVLVIVGTGQEHRFGRWLDIKSEGGGINATFVITLIPESSSQSRTLNGRGDGGGVTLTTNS